MIGKLVKIFVFAVAVVAIASGVGAWGQAAPAQAGAGQAPTQTPAQAPASTPAQAPAEAGKDPQQPDASSSSTDTELEIGKKKKSRPKDFKKWVYNVGGGANLPGGTTNLYVKGGGGVVAAGVTRNHDRYLGLRLDFQFADLPLRVSALEAAQAPSGSDHAFTLMLDPIINIPVNKKYSGYLLFGPNWVHRSGKLDSSTIAAGSACNAFYAWWGTCFNASLPLNKNFLETSQNEFGFNVGGGVARKISSRFEVYAEARYIHAKHNDTSTDVKPITVGIRW